MKPITPEDVPNPKRWACQRCQTWSNGPVTEHLLGGWALIRCGGCRDLTYHRPLKEERRDDDRQT